MSNREMIVATLVATGLVLAAGGWAATTVKYSGTIVAVDPEGKVFTLAEVGPWHVKAGKTVTTLRMIHLTPQTQYTMFMRVNAPGRYTGDFIEVPLEAADIAVGDHVTAECRVEAGRLVATKVSTVDPTE